MAPQAERDDEITKSEASAETENMWGAEIERRRREVREGTVQPVTGEAFLRELRNVTPAR